MLVKIKDGRILNLLYGEKKETLEFRDGRWCDLSRPVSNDDLANAEMLNQEELKMVFLADQCSN